jgi:low affinity Fe/Cu permease
VLRDWHEDCEVSLGANYHEKGANMQAWFAVVASRVSKMAGSPWAFMVATAAVLVWLSSGPVFGFSQTWQLIINTGTTIVTFLMVFLIQNTQNRDEQALHLKLDELLRAVEGARESIFVDLEDRDQKQLAQLREELFAECMPGETVVEHKDHVQLPGAPGSARGRRLHSAG